MQARFRDSWDDYLAIAPVKTPVSSNSPSGACTSAADDWWMPLLRLPGGVGGAPGVCSGTCGPRQRRLVRGKEHFRIIELLRNEAPK